VTESTVEKGSTQVSIMRWKSYT